MLYFILEIPKAGKMSDKASVDQKTHLGSHVY